MTRSSPSVVRRWLPRVALLVLAPVVLLGMLEIGLRIGGFGYATTFFVSDDESGSLLSNPSFSWRFFGTDLARSPIPIRMEASKPPRTYRIFVLGASAARGEPNPAFSFSRVLELILEEFFPDTNFEIINTGMTAINSHVVLPIAKECLELDPDLIIVYLGNNEVVGPFGAGSSIRSFSPSLGVIRAGLRVRDTRVGQFMAGLSNSLARKNRSRKWGGMAMFIENKVTEDDPRLDTVYSHFEANLGAICDRAREHGTPVILSTVITNLADQIPLLSVHREGLGGADLARWQRLRTEGMQAAAQGQPHVAEQKFRAAIEIDPGYAELHFLRGRNFLAVGEPESALQSLRRARDLDALRFRADTQINEAIRRVAAARGGPGGGGSPVILVDAERAVIGDPGQNPRIPGEDLLYEHVHFKLSGNYEIAAQLLRPVIGLLPPSITRQPAQDLRLPGLAECGARLLYTPFDQLANATRILAITGKPPFPPSQRAGDREYVHQLRSRLDQSMLDNSRTAYEKALRDRQDDLLMRSNFADLLYGVGENEAAAEQWGHVIERYPLSADWFMRRGLAMQKLGRTRVAMTEFQRSLEINPARVDVRIAMAAAFRREGRVDDALTELERALELWPANVAANCALGEVLLGRGDRERALNHLVVAVEESDDARCASLLGVALRERVPGREALALSAVSLESVVEIAGAVLGLTPSVDWKSLAAAGYTSDDEVDLLLANSGGEGVWRGLSAAVATVGLRLERGSGEVTLALAP